MHRLRALSNWWCYYNTVQESAGESYCRIWMVLLTGVVHV